MLIWFKYKFMGTYLSNFRCLGMYVFSNVYICMYVYMYVCMYVRIYVPTYVLVYVYVRMFIWKNIYSLSIVTEHEDIKCLRQ